MRAACFLAAALFLAQTPSAQTEWREHPAGASVSYDVLSLQSTAHFGVSSVIGPSYGYNTSRLFSAHLLSARVPVSSRVTLLAEVPVVYRDYAISDEDAVYLDQIRINSPSAAVELGETGSQVALGNPMVGAEVAFGSALRLDASVRVPSQRSTEGIDSSWFIGQSFRAADRVSRVIENERSEAYQTGVTSLTLGVNGRAELPGGVALTGRIAPVLSVTDRDVHAALDPEGTQPASTLSVRFGSLVRGDAGPVALGLGVVGMLESRVGRQNVYWYRDSITGLVQIGLKGLPVRPGMQFRAGISGYQTNEHVLSLSLDVPLR